ncbi:MAG: hypothetical protein K6F88_01015 [Ruminococcus sp.]|nr:hypothetical protein [Ruminococcus sp.]
MELQAKNPDDRIDVSFYTDSEEPLEVELYSTVVQQDKKDYLSVLSLIHKEYDAVE